MENVTPMHPANGSSVSGELNECFQETKALADVIWSIDTGGLVTTPRRALASCCLREYAGPRS